MPSSCNAELRQARDERHQGSCEPSQLLGFEPARLPCVTVPDLVTLIGRRYGIRGVTRPDRERVELSAGGPPAEPLSNWEDRGRVATNPTHRSLRSSPPLCLAVGGHGGVSGTLAHQVNSRHTEAKGVLADPLYVFGAVGRPVGNRNDRTSRCRQTRENARRSRIHVQNRTASSREFRGARLDFKGHIWVRRIIGYRLSNSKV